MRCAQVAALQTFSGGRGRGESDCRILCAHVSLSLSLVFFLLLRIYFIIRNCPIKKAAIQRMEVEKTLYSAMGNSIVYVVERFSRHRNISNGKPTATGCFVVNLCGGKTKNKKPLESSRKNTFFFSPFFVTAQRGSSQSRACVCCVSGRRQGTLVSTGLGWAEVRPRVLYDPAAATLRSRAGRPSAPSPGGGRDSGVLARNRAALEEPR